MKTIVEFGIPQNALSVKRPCGVSGEIICNSIKAGIRAASFFRCSGGLILPVNNGKLISAVYLGQDDYGNAVYDTLQGIAVTHKKFCKLI